METDAFLRQLDDDGARLVTVLADADLDAPVPGLDWTVGETAAHLGAVHRWAADLVRERRTEVTARSASFTPPPGTDVRAFSRDAHRELGEALRDAPEDLQVWGFGRPVPARAFWSRRQAHETAVHRADLEAGAGVEVGVVPVEVAQDGLGEITGFARGFRVAGSPLTLGLRAADGDDWLVSFADGRVVAERGADVGGADATVSGSSSDLHLWAWNRPSGAVVEGDPAAVARWREVRIA